VCRKLKALTDHRGKILRQGYGLVNANMRKAGISLDLPGPGDENCVRSYVSWLTVLPGTRRKTLQHPVRWTPFGGASERKPAQGCNPETTEVAGLPSKPNVPLEYGRPETFVFLVSLS